MKEVPTLGFSQFRALTQSPYHQNKCLLCATYAVVARESTTGSPPARNTQTPRALRSRRF